MAMQLLDQQSFEKEIQKAGFTPTKKRSKLGRIWKAENGLKVIVPNIKESVPDFVLDEVLKEVGRLYRPPER